MQKWKMLFHYLGMMLVYHVDTQHGYVFAENSVF
jgi:hypothetical protein